MKLEAGPLRIEVVEPLRTLRLLCAGEPDELALDVVWQAEFPAVWEPHHVGNTGDRLTLEGRRFVQAGWATG
jgi:hypothetical protein